MLYSVGEESKTVICGCYWAGLVFWFRVLPISSFGECGVFLIISCFFSLHCIAHHKNTGLV